MQPKKITLRTQHTTTNYGLFEAHSINRVIVDGNKFKPRADILKSMRAQGYRPMQPIMCVLDDGKLRVVDGHNRLATAKHLGLPVEFIAYAKGDEITPLEYSTAQKLWTSTDMARAYAQEGDPDYSEVLAYMEATGHPLQCCFSMFWGEVAGNGNVYPKIKDGSFRVRDRDHPWKVAQATKLIKKFEPKWATHMSLIHAISKAMHAEGFELDRLLDRISKCPEVLRKCRTAEDYLKMLEDIYNFRMRSERYHLVIEVEKAMRRRDPTVKQ